MLLALSLFVASTFAQTAVTCDQDYTARAGDSLPKLASKFYGNASEYAAIVTQTNLKSRVVDTYKLNGRELTPISEKELVDMASHSLWYPK